MSKKRDADVDRKMAGDEWVKELTENEHAIDNILEDSEFCFYCGGVTPKTGEGDHMPYPSCVGGKFKVPCCVSCHQMKDPIGVDSWNPSWIVPLFQDMGKMSRESKLFLMKLMRICAEVRHCKEIIKNSQNIKASARKLEKDREKFEQEKEKFEQDKKFMMNILKAN